MISTTAMIYTLLTILANMAILDFGKTIKGDLKYDCDRNGI